MRGKATPGVAIHQAHRASNCFSEAEVALMASLLEHLLRGADATRLIRAPAFRQVAGKFSRMRKLVEIRRRLP